MSAEEFLDIAKNLVSVREHLIIAESKYAIAARSEIRCAEFLGEKQKARREPKH
jgi:hypothetical protein